MKAEDSRHIDDNENQSKSEDNDSFHQIIFYDRKISMAVHRCIANNGFCKAIVGFLLVNGERLAVKIFRYTTLDAGSVANLTRNFKIAVWVKNFHLLSGIILDLYFRLITEQLF